MFGNVNKPIYGLTGWNDAYKEGHCFVSFYVSKLRRDRRVAYLLNCGFDVRSFEVKLPGKTDG